MNYQNPVPRDPFESYGTNDFGFQFGSLIKHNGKTGGWSIGKGNEPVDLGACYVIVYEASLVGFTKWVDGRPDHALRPLSSAPDLPTLRETLGDLDQSRWARNAKGEPQDPWKKSVVMPFVDPESVDESYTFSTSSFGAVRAAGRLIRACAAKRRTSPEETRGRYPLIKLGETSYDAGRLGKIFNPTFTVDDWVPAGPINEILRLVGAEVPAIQHIDEPSSAPETIHEIVEPEPRATPATPATRGRTAPQDEDDSEPDVQVRGRSTGGSSS